MAAFVEFIKQQWAVIPPLADVSLEGQTVLITGASSGLGLEMAKHIAARSPGKLIVTGRDAQRMAGALDEIVHSTGCKNVVAWSLDMDSNESIKKFAERLSEHGRLDLAVLNAGVMKSIWTTASTGHETTLQSNVFGTFATFLLLAPLLKKTTHTHRNGVPTRAIIVASDTHTWIPSLPNTPTLLSDLDSKERSEAAAKSKDVSTQQLALSNRYPVSKLLEILIVQEMVKHIDAKDILLVTANPALCHSSLSRDVPGIQSYVFALMKYLVARTTETGARALLYPAFAEQITPGRYFSNSVDYPVSAYASSAAASKVGKNLYHELLADLVKVDKRVTEILS